MRVIDAVKETIADISSASPSSERMRVGYCFPHGLINTQLIQQFVFRRADAVAFHEVEQLGLAFTTLLLLL